MINYNKGLIFIISYNFHNFTSKPMQFFTRFSLKQIHIYGNDCIWAKVRGEQYMSLNIMNQFYCYENNLYVADQLHYSLLSLLFFFGKLKKNFK